jgi:bifunctional ADP-heptose synthase (sugar kinase/adenylyltransferase)
VRDRLDTRKKIVTLEKALTIAAAEPVRWVTGHFDPLFAQHARRIREFIEPGYRLIVLVTNPAEPLLPQRARAELVAALAGVDFVVMKDGAAPANQHEDDRIRQEFIDNVIARHGGERAT